MQLPVFDCDFHAHVCSSSCRVTVIVSVCSQFDACAIDSFFFFSFSICGRSLALQHVAAALSPERALHPNDALLP